MSKTTYKALGAYIFAGGFTRGVLDSRRFEVVEHLEEGMYGVPTAKLNFPKLPIRVGLDTWEPERWKSKIDFVYGNPPCAAWSRLNGKKTGSNLTWKRDPRVSCTRRHFELLTVIRPKVWVWESVDMAFHAGAELVYELSQEAVSLGYAVSHLRFDAQYVGGAHRRLRYFMIAHRHEFDWSTIRFVKPPTTAEVLARAKRYKTADDLLIVPIPKSLLPAWKATPPGEPIRRYWDRLNPPEKRTVRVSSTGREFILGRPGFSKVKLDPDAVCWTVVGNNLIHHEQPRFMTMGEQKALCGYPPGWRVENPGSPSGARLDLLTRAVMPPIGRWLAGLVVNALDNGRVIRKPRIEVVDARRPDAFKVEAWQHETKVLHASFKQGQQAFDFAGGVA